MQVDHTRNIQSDARLLRYVTPVPVDGPNWHEMGLQTGLGYDAETPVDQLDPHGLGPGDAPTENANPNGLG